MEDIKDNVLNGGNVVNEKEGFFNFVFKFDKDTQSELLNVSQYVILSIVPIIIVLRLIRNFVPEDDPEKNNLEIVIEIIGQLLFIFGAIFLIHRVILYIPTYSKMPYGEMNLFNVILVILFILFTMQTKLGAKTNILIDRFNDLLDGKTTVKSSKAKVKVSQPLAKNNEIKNNTEQVNVHQPSQADNHQSNPMVPNPPNQAIQQALNIDPTPDFNQMYVNSANPLQNAQTPGMMGGMYEPEAANSSGGFGSPF
jgi:hypothetical protein